MEKLEQQKSRDQMVKELINRAPQRIEEEFNRTTNTWLECFGSSIFQIETYLDMDKLKEEIGAEKHKNAITKLEELKNRHHSLKQQYPDKDTIPPENMKQELLALLNVFE
jgi:hypothetical protein